MWALQIVMLMSAASSFVCSQADPAATAIFPVSGVAAIDEDCSYMVLIGRLTGWLRAHNLWMHEAGVFTARLHECRQRGFAVTSGGSWGRCSGCRSLARPRASTRKLP